MTEKTHNLNVKGIVERMTLPFIFQYDYLSPCSKISVKGTRFLLLAWMVADVALQTWVSPWTIFYGVMALSAYLLAWKAPPLLGAAIAGVQLTRVFSGFLIVLTLKSGVPKDIGLTLEWILLFIQGWVLVATLGLVLKYIRTPKRLMAQHLDSASKIHAS